MNIQEFNLKTGITTRRPRIICNDGFSMSVQGSEYHYCSPRKNKNEYYEMEIGFPSKREQLILNYAEQKHKPKKTVYGYVPVNLIDEVIKKHGGIDKEKTFKNNR